MGPAASTERHVRHKPYLVQVALAAVALGVMALVASRSVPRWERRLFTWIYDLPDWIEPVVWLPMQLGNLLGPVVVAAGAWIAWHRWRPAAGALVVGLVAWFGAKGVKDVVHRGRPFAVLQHIVLRSGTPQEGLGFVSGHSTVAFALATVLSPYFQVRWHRWVAYGLAAVVAFARVHVGAHLPLDVLGGAALGSLLGWTWHFAVGVPESVVRRRPANVE